MSYSIGYERQQWLCMLSAQLLLVVFDLAYDSSYESLQLLRIESLYYNKQYSLRHYCLFFLPKYCRIYGILTLDHFVYLLFILAEFKFKSCDVTIV